MHIGHQNVLEFDNRPFETLEEMHETIRNNWNSVVGNEDVVYILGDFIFSFKEEYIEYVKSLNGRKRLIKGNHDKCNSGVYKNLFEKISDYEKIKDENRVVILSHYPMMAYDGSYENRNYHLYAHVHTTEEYEFIKDVKKIKQKDGFGLKMFNAGCMLNNYFPLTLDELIQRGDT